MLITDIDASFPQRDRLFMRKKPTKPRSARNERQHPNGKKRSQNPDAPPTAHPSEMKQKGKQVRSRRLSHGESRSHLEKRAVTLAPKLPNALRDSPDAEIVYGKHSVRAVLLKRPQAVEKLLLAGKEAYHDEIIQLARIHNVETYLLPWPDFIAEGGFSSEDKHQGVLAVTSARVIQSEADLDNLQDACCVLVLDQVSNPQNLATIIRSAAFFHADAILYMKNRAATPTPEVVRFAVGGAEMIELYQITNVAQSLDKLKELGFVVLGMDERGKKTLAQHDLSGKTAFVIGAEGEGLRNKTRQYCSDLVRIPGGLDGVESLNAAVATTIALYEFARLMEDNS
ncbi:MAG: TrmH family RNA methyltransferase [Rhizobiaceae bacterium]